MKTLYKKSSSGKTQFWCMEVKGSSTRTSSGIVGGAVKETKWTDHTAKNVGKSNELSAEQAALSYFESKKTLQIKKGYRETVEQAMSSDRFQCMLAQSFREDLVATNGDLRSRTSVQPKLDGIRCIADASGLWTRAGNQIHTAPHIVAALKPFFSAHPTVRLDGELYNHSLRFDFNKIVSLVRKVNPSALELEEARNTLEFWVYDCVKEGSFPERWEFLEDAADSSLPVSYDFWVVESVLDKPCVVLVDTIECVTLQDVYTYFGEFLSHGFEGAMVRTDGPYEHKRSNNLLKLKTSQDAEFTLLHIEKGNGNAREMAKIATLLLPNGATFKADIVGTVAELKSLLGTYQNVLGKPTTISFQSYTPAGVPRFGKLKVAHQEHWSCERQDVT